MNTDWKLVDMKPFDGDEKTNIYIYRHNDHRMLRIVIVGKNEIEANMRLEKLMKEGKIG